ncbi:6-phosphogluconolactonase [Paraglaciecola arctica]|uniref:6-phosphogluconolactonase n=1 Tax=Paraglaciecola arctica TaxID=1128911 RepID=UPI001C078A86|nr:6-phosphogluconolactonase [Paraglaciecola arctica]MBU3002534.1 6-phosphogluconolactonase [Paraglaciecola arctica]
MALTQSKFRTTEQLNTAFTRKIVKLLRDGIEENGRASLVVSGGRTPAELFGALSKAHLEWDKVDVSLADERWVDNTDDASNEKMLRTKLLINNAANANFVPLKTYHGNAEDAVSTCTENLQKMHTPFDVLILGMGEDGHTASLFPCSEQIAEGLDLESGKAFIAVQPASAPNQRMSLTLPALLNSNQIFLHLTGESKKAVLDTVLSDDDALVMPIRAVINNADVELVWAP